MLYENLSFKLPAGGIVGIVGANGTGKSTLFKMIAGSEKPDAGRFKIGETAKISYVDQSREIDGTKTIYDVISGGTEYISLGNKEVNSRAYISKFNFSGDDQKKLVTQLSGGERNRVHLASTLKDGGNVLLLDELMILMLMLLMALENALIDYAGCAVVISHDRFFLDRIATIFWRSKVIVKQYGMMEIFLITKKIKESVLEMLLLIQNELLIKN